MSHPQRTFFDPSFERLPAPVAGESASAGPVLLVFDPGADREWAADAAVALATGWHAAGRRTVLADLCIDDPFLHERIGMPNQEGLVDIFLYGASMARSARAVPGRGFYLISSGTYTPDPGAVLRNPRWEKIVATFRENEAALLLFAPSDAPEIETLANWVAAAVVLGGGTLPAAAEHFLVRAWLAPPREPAGAAPPPPARPARPAERFPEPEPGVPWSAPAGAREAAGAAAPPPAEIPVPAADWDEEPAPAEPKRSSAFLLLLALLVLGAVALAALPRYVSGFPDPFGVRGGGAADPPAPGAPAPAPVPAGDAAASGETLPYSIQVANYQRREEAVQEAAAVARRFPEAQFFVVPENVQGMTWWRVMAGMGEDTTALLGLRDRLIAERVVDEEAFGGRFNIIQRRPFAYQVGEYVDPAAARARADSLSARAIPAYVAPVPFSDGTERWRVYAGAYRDSASAAPMRDLLRGATLEPELVERTGRPPATPK